MKFPGTSAAHIVLILTIGIGGCQLSAQNDTISVNRTSLTFCVASNTSPSPTPRTLTVLATNGPVVYDAVASPGWIRLNGSGPGKTITANTSSSPNVVVQIDPSGYATGTSATGLIQINSGPTLINVIVTLNVTPGCVDNGPLNATPSSITLTPSNASRPVSITGPSGESVNSVLNFGNGPVGWFSIAASNLAVLPFTLTVSSNVLTPSVVYNGTITLTTNVTQSTVTIPVAFTAGSNGSGAFIVSPVAISQNFSASTSGAVSQLIAINPGLVTGVSITATIDLGNGPSGWITLTSAPGTVPTSATVTIDPSNLTNGTFTGTITFTQTGVGANFVTVPITATVGVTGVFSVDVTPVNFNIAAGAVSQTQQVNVSGPANAQIVVNSQINNGPTGWLAVTPNGAVLSSAGAAQLTVTVNASVLSPGILYNGTILILQNGVTTLTVPVNVIVGGPSAITVTPAQLNLAYQMGTAAPPSQTINVSSPAGTSITFLAAGSTSKCGNWIVVTPTQSSTTNGTVPIPVTVSINTTSLTTASSCSGNVTITATGATNPTTTIPVSLLVTPNPVVSASPSSISFNLQSSSPAPPAQTISVASSSTPLGFSVITIPTSGPNFLTVSQTSGATPANLSIGIIPAVIGSLTPGTYVENILISAPNSANGTIILPVTITVSNITTLVVNPGSLTSNYQIGQAQPASQLLTVASAGAALPFTATAISTNCNDFLRVFPSSGLTTAGLSQSGGQIAVTANLSGLTSPVTCTGSIVITSPASLTSITVPVTVNVVSSAVINIAKTNILQTASLGSSSLITVQIPVTASDNTTQINFSTAAAGQSWLSVFPQTGSTPTSIFVQLNPANLAAGVYTGVVTVNDTRFGPAVPVQLIQVMLIVSGQASVTPGSLNFVLSQGGTTPSQTITVNNVLSGTTISANPVTFVCGANWITTNISGNSINVGINGNGLTAALSPCLGEVSIVVPGASNSPINVPVSVKVNPAINLSVSNAKVVFGFTIGSGTSPVNQSVQLTATNNSVIPYAAAFTTQDVANLFVLSVNSGNIPAILTIAVNPSVLATLAPGTFSGTLTITSPNLVSVLINVSLTVSLPSQPTITAVVNGANQRVGPLSPGELITIYGNNIGPPNPLSLTLTAAGTIATKLGDTSVLFDGVAAPLLYVSSNQINATVPYEIGGRGQMTLAVTRAGVTSNAVEIRGADTSLGIFTVDSSGQGQAAVLNQDGSVNGSNAPASRGSIISIFATGEGQLSPPGATGSITPLNSPAPKPLAGPTTLVFRISNADGTTTDVPATVTYAAEAPGLVSGVMQVNAVVPRSVSSGSQIVILSLGNASSPPVVMVQVQ